MERNNEASFGRRSDAISEFPHECTPYKRAAVWQTGAKEMEWRPFTHYRMSAAKLWQQYEDLMLSDE